ncbi:MAG: response regulator transcription factor [Vampirovibrionales bacterium]
MSCLQGVFTAVLHILIADDDPDLLSLYHMDFELLGFHIHLAKNGLEAYKLLEQPVHSHPIDVVILDVMMPKMDGFEVCKRVRQLPHRADVPMILITAKGLLEDKVRGFHSGADDYIVKPFEFQELMVRIRALCRRSGRLPSPMAAASSSVHSVASTSGKKSDKEETLVSGVFRLLTSSLEVVIEGRIQRLTPTEFEILYCLLQHANEPVSLSTLLREVWGYDADEDVRMLRVHIGGLRQKLEANPKQPVYLHTVPNVGYKLVTS